METDTGGGTQPVTGPYIGQSREHSSNVHVAGIVLVLWVSTQSGRISLILLWMFSVPIYEEHDDDKLTASDGCCCWDPVGDNAQGDVFPT